MEKQQCPIEIERKFLIRYPDTDMLCRQSGVRRMVITQTYLTAEKGITARVRKIEENGAVRYVSTEKKRISARSATEIEHDLSREQYESLLKNADATRNTIEKVRYAVPFGSHTAEIDLYPFWTDRAVLEIELSSEDEACALPGFVELIREVTEDVRYKNVNLAVTVPNDSVD